jgi:hypothetical protein
MTSFVQDSLLSLDEKRVLEAMLAPGAGTAGALNGAVAGLSVQEFGSQAAGGPHTTVITLNGVSMTFRDTQQGNGVKIYTFPKGKIVRLGASAENVQIVTTSDPATTLNASITGNWGVGSTTQASVTLATTEQDFVQVTAFTSSATQGAYPTAVRGYGLGTFTVLDGSGTAIDVYFNAACVTATDVDADAAVKLYGTVTLNWLRT